MKNVLIMGSGRSGTSMVAGCMAKSCYFMGEQLFDARGTNPKGFFEDIEINSINEAILARVVPGRPQFLPGKLRKYFFRRRPDEGQRWLARIPASTTIPEGTDVRHRIKKMISKTPYCFKDPRFSYTLPVWRSFLKDTVFVCVFREPTKTVKSILKECREADYLKSFSITEKQVFEVWLLMYKHILEKHQHEGTWLFLHYDQVFQKEGLDRLAAFSGSDIDSAFPDIRFRRSEAFGACPREVMNCYRQLCALAEFKISE